MPRGGYAPTLHGVEPKYIYEAMLTGPQTMPTFSNGNLSPEEKRDVIAYLGSLEETPEYGGFGLGGLAPVSEGHFAWILGIGGLYGDVRGVVPVDVPAAQMATWVADNSWNTGVCVLLICVGLALLYFALQQRGSSEWGRGVGHDPEERGGGTGVAGPP